jgi:hypothetical protein
VERLVRFVKRNRLAVAVATLILLLGIFGAWKTLEARIQSARADDMSLLIGLLERQDPATVSAPVRVQEVRKLREAIGRDLASGGRNLSPQRIALLQRGMKYLEKVKPYAAADAELAREVAATYKEVGTIYQPIDASATGGPDPGGPNSGQLHGPGGTLAEPVVSRSGPAPRLPPVSNPAEPAGKPHPAEPTPAAAPPPPVDQATYEEVKARLDSVTSKAGTADRLIEDLRKNAKAQGRVLHPDIEAHYGSMKGALDAAKKALDEGNIPAAKEKLDIASAFADRVMRDGGR